MSFREELLFDFAEHIPRILVCGDTIVVDSVKRVEIVTDTQIVVKSGKSFLALSGAKLFIKELACERMLIEGEIKEIQFYGMEYKGQN
ncbi:MAG: hypothetical protein E7225_02220 [Clostridiales bacterium]|nr:hypothetical protein [Clostridiales bacterium]